MGAEKANCYQCEYRRNLAGSCHSSCGHPVYEKLGSLAILVAFDPAYAEKLREVIEVKGNPAAIEKGWFMHPVDFDPAWLESCTGFKKKLDKEG